MNLWFKLNKIILFPFLIFYVIINKNIITNKTKKMGLTPKQRAINLEKTLDCIEDFNDIDLKKLRLFLRQIKTAQNLMHYKISVETNKKLEKYKIQIEEFEVLKRNVTVAQKILQVLRAVNDFQSLGLDILKKYQSEIGIIYSRRIYVITDSEDYELGDFLEEIENQISFIKNNTRASTEAYLSVLHYC